MARSASRSTSVERTAPKSSIECGIRFRSKLAAGALGGIDKIFIAPGAGVLYLGAASRTSINHVVNIVGPVCLFAERGLTLFNRCPTFSHYSQEGVMYPAEFDSINMARKRKNVTRASV